jgi:hypothetical protein
VKIPIRTTQGKMFGMLEVHSYILYIKDGKNHRLIHVPLEGLKLVYAAETGRREVIVIPPKHYFSRFS